MSIRLLSNHNFEILTSPQQSSVACQNFNVEHEFLKHCSSDLFVGDDAQKALNKTPRLNRGATN